MASYYGQALMNIGSIIGSNMTRSIQEDERQADRLELQRERLAAAERENERNRQLRAEMAAARAPSGGGDGGLSAKDIGEGGADEGLLARRAGMTVPELRAMRRFSETGDSTPFQVETNKITMKDTGDPYNPETQSQLVKELPPGFEREARAKLQTLAKIEESYRLGGKYDDVTKGRRNQQEVDMSEAAIRQPGAAGVISQGMAAGEGKDLFGGDSNQTRNLKTGATSTTAVGESVIRENNAQTAKYSAETRKVLSEASGALQKGASQEKLATMLSSLNKLAESTDLDDAGRKRVQELQMSIVDAMKTNVDGRGGTGADKGKLSEADAHAQAQRALATGKITLDDVNKRLTGAGYKPLPADAGKAGAPKPSPGPAPTAAPAPRQEAQPAPDSRVGKARQAQAEAAATKQAWEDEQRSKASTAFAELDLKDRLAASKLQASPLFAYLTREQKTAIYNAVNSR